MKKLFLVSSLLLLSSCANKIDFEKAKISPNPKNETEWRTSTIYKVVKMCLDTGGNEATCNCYIDVSRKKYKENDYLLLRQKVLDKVQKNEGIYAHKKDLIEVTNIMQSCNK